MITIKDIAKYCGVSVSTVSYALSNNSTISEKTKQRVREAAKALNYVPNSNARSLKQKSTHKIGVFVPGFQGPIHPTILAGIAHILRNIDEKYNMIVTFADEDMSLIKQRSIDLAIIMDAKTSKDLIVELSDYMPIITFDQDIEHASIYNTFVDNTKAMMNLTNLMIKKGCRRIGYVLGSSSSYHNELRFTGYKEGLKENGIPFNNDLVYNADAFTEFKGQETISILLENLDELPFDGLICANDELAIGALQALKEHNYQVPKDCLIAGFDDIEKTLYVHPNLTTVKVDWFSYGKQIAELALEILNKKNPNQSLTIHTTIIERESTSNLTTSK
ncbi:MAG: LacI family DNA-binding transcriptional regulator [Acholeplasmataceae bacterium]